MVSSSLKNSDYYSFTVWKPLGAVVYFVSLATFKYAAPHLCQKYAIPSVEFEETFLWMKLFVSIHIFVLLAYLGSQLSLSRTVTSVSLMILMLIGLVVGIKCYRLASAFEPPTRDETIGIVREHIMKTEEIPPWLEHAQITQKCCGIYDFKDYRAFIYRGKQEKFKEDVPISCCHSSSQARAGKCIPGNPSVHSDSDPTAGITGIFITEPRWLQLLNHESVDKFAPQIDRKDYILNQILPHTNSSKRGNYHVTGCYGYLLKQTETLHQFFLMFFTVTTTISFALGLHFLVQNRAETVQGVPNAKPKSSRLRSGIFDTSVHRRRYL